MNKLIWVAAAAGAIASTAGCAGNGAVETATASPVVCSSYGQIDKDNNGIINQAEWGGFRNGVFNDWDTNNDRRVSRAEFQNCWRAGGFRNDANFEFADWDDNFGAFDDDNDGFLGSPEFFGSDEFGMFDDDGDFGLEVGLNEWGF